MKLSNFIKKRKKKDEYVSSTRKGINTQSWTMDSITYRGALEENQVYVVGESEPLSDGERIQDMEKKPVKPATVIAELFEPQIIVNCDNINEKIKALKKRKRQLKKSKIDTERVVKGLIWLEARKKLLGKTKKEVSEEFPWKITTDNAIDKLCDKYKLDVDNIENYEEFIPPEALKEMEIYIKLFNKYTKGREPRLRIVLPSRVVRKKKKEKDPIIVAESPFADFYFVLGAWDKEVEIMHELWKDILE